MRHSGSFKKGNTAGFKPADPSRPLNSKSCGLRFFEDQHEYLYAIAEDRGITISQLIREMTDLYIDWREQSAA